jgi:hypothetical protein
MIQFDLPGSCGAGEDGTEEVGASPKIPCKVLFCSFLLSKIDFRASTTRLGNLNAMGLGRTSIVVTLKNTFIVI